MIGPAPDLRLIHHHVGGRAGHTGFNFPAIFEPGLVRVLYDADASSTEQAQAQSVSSGRTTITRPYFIGRPGVKQSFQINYDPYTSSIRKIAPEFSSYYVEVNGTDYVMGEVTQPLRTVEVDAHGLDELVRTEGEKLPAPDLLSLDTEGSEDDILAGARELLDDRVVALTTEVKFNPVYADGPTFGDIFRLMFERGFVFCEFEHVGRLTPMRGRLGTRGRGLIAFGDAIFLKHPANIRGDDATRALKLRKLAFVALTRAQLEFAQLCLGLLPEGHPLPADAPAYLRLVEQFRLLCAMTPDVKPWRFTEAYTPERSEARFRSAIPDAEARRIADETRQRAIAETGKIESAKLDLAHAAGTSMMVQLFERYGLVDVARVIAETQRHQVQSYLASVAEMSAG